MYGNDVVDPTEALNASETPEFDEAVAAGEAAEARDGVSSFDALPYSGSCFGLRLLARSC